MSRLALLSLSLLLSVGCAKPPISPSVAQATNREPDSATMKVSTAACTSDSDCRLYSSYCEARPCECIALAPGDSAPVCKQGTVSCFVNPCMQKTAQCTQGRCVVSGAAAQ